MVEGHESDLEACDIRRHPVHLRQFDGTSSVSSEEELICRYLMERQRRMRILSCLRSSSLEDCRRNSRASAGAWHSPALSIQTLLRIWVYGQCRARVEASLSGSKHGHHFASICALRTMRHATCDMRHATCSHNLDFRNATKADPEWSVLQSASVHSLACFYARLSLTSASWTVSRHRSAWWGRRHPMLSSRRNPVWRSQSEPLRRWRLFQAEFVRECESVYDDNEMNKHEWMISVSASRLSTSMREWYISSWRRVVDNDEIAERWRIHW
jgi:hypothetical protein